MRECVGDPLSIREMTKLSYVKECKFHLKSKFDEIELDLKSTFHSIMSGFDYIDHFMTFNSTKTKCKVKSFRTSFFVISCSILDIP